MAAQQFSLVVFRGLAVVAAFYGLNLAYLSVGAFLLTGPDPHSKARFVSIAIVCAFILLAAFLWTFAEKLAVAESLEKVTVKGGNWVVRLVFTALGLLIMILSLSSLAPTFLQIYYPEFIREEKVVLYTDIAVDALKFLIGLYIFMTYRFDKAAAFEAAQAIQSSTTEE